MAVKAPRSIRKIFTIGCIVSFAAGIAVALVHHISFFSHLERAAADFRIAAFQEPIPPSRDIVVLAVDEETLTRFPYRSPVDRAFLSELLRQLDKRMPAVIGVDMLFDQPTEAAKDRALYQTIRTLNTPLFISYTTTPSVVTPAQLEYMNAFVPPEFRAAANLATDPFDGSVRWIFPGEVDADTPIGFARKAVQLAGRQLPPAEQVEIAWRPQIDSATSTFAIYPAHALAALPIDWFKGKIVLVGAVLSLTDRHRTPLAIAFDDDRGMMPGILVQAHAISTYFEQRSTRRPSSLSGLFFALVMAGLGASIAFLANGLFLTLALAVILVLAVWAIAFVGYEHGLPLLPLVAPTLALSLSLWAVEMWLGRQERFQRQFVQGAFSRYVSPDVVQQLIDDPSRLTVSSRRQVATFIFTDIAGFTSLSESLDSRNLSDLLNAYLDGVCQIVLRHQGTIDKFIGDAVMAIFNAPLALPDHAERAVRCAIELDKFAQEFREIHNRRGVPLGVTRIGLHCGQAVVGNFGSHTRMDYTALGDSVNVAARVEGVNKLFGTRICCTQAIVDQCKEVKFLPLGDVLLKGKTLAVALYTPQLISGDFDTQYLAAFRAIERNPDIAIRLFQKLLDTYPDAELPRFYLDRLMAGITSTHVVMNDK